MGYLFFNLLFRYPINLVLKFKMFITAKSRHRLERDRCIYFHYGITFSHTDPRWGMGSFNIRFFHCRTHCFWNKRLHRLIEKIITPNELFDNTARSFTFSKARNVNPLRNFIVRSLKMTLNAIFFYFDVKNSLTIFNVITRYFQRSLRNTQTKLLSSNKHEKSASRRSYISLNCNSGLEFRAYFIPKLFRIMIPLCLWHHDT